MHSQTIGIDHFNLANVLSETIIRHNHTIYHITDAFRYSASNLSYSEYVDGIQDELVSQLGHILSYSVHRRCLK